MTVYEIPHIEHCSVEPIGSPAVMYRIISNDGWYIHLNNGIEDTENVWKGAVALLPATDFSMVEICAEADLPEGAEVSEREVRQ